MSKKRALVTGGSRGIGKAISIMLAKNGYDVLINYRGNIDAANKTKSEIESHGGQCTLLKFDISDFKNTTEIIQKELEVPLWLVDGFNGILTFARQYDEVVKYAPLDRILLETDAPFLAPEPYRGKRNEPFYVVEVAKKIAELKNETLEKITDQTTENCKKLFGLL